MFKNSKSVDWSGCLGPHSSAGQASNSLKNRLVIWTQHLSNTLGTWTSWCVWWKQEGLRITLKESMQYHAVPAPDSSEKGKLPPFQERFRDSRLSVHFSPTVCPSFKFEVLLSRIKGLTFIWENLPSCDFQWCCNLAIRQLNFNF